MFERNHLGSTATQTKHTTEVPERQAGAPSQKAGIGGADAAGQSRR